jgi:hypothetical protein
MRNVLFHDCATTENERKHLKLEMVNRASPAGEHLKESPDSSLELCFTVHANQKMTPGNGHLHTYILVYPYFVSCLLLASIPNFSPKIQGFSPNISYFSPSHIFIPDFSPNVPDFSPNVPDFSPNSGRTRLTALDCSVAVRIYGHRRQPARENVRARFEL